MVDLTGDDPVVPIRGAQERYEMAEHAHADHGMLLLPLAGSMTVGDETHRVGRPLEQGHFYFAGAGIGHTTRGNRRHQEHLAVYVDRGWERLVRRRHAMAATDRPPAGIWRLSDTASDLARILARDLRGTAAGRGNGRRRTVVSALLAEECLSVMGRGPASPVVGHPEDHGGALVADAFERLRADLTDPPSIDALAAELAVSRRHLTRLFRAKTGLSIGEALRRERLREGRRLLAETDWSVQQVAAMIGIDSAANFASSFRRAFGRSPSDCRRIGHGPEPKAD